MDMRQCELRMPFLRSCRREISSPISGITTGSIPEWLQGTVIRIGSGLLDVGPDHYAHVFDGFALMHKFSICNRKITYQNSFLRSDTYTKNTKANRIIVPGFATRATTPDPCKTIFQRFTSFFTLTDFSDNDLINIVKYSDDFYACSESNYIWKINSKTLESEEKIDLRKFLPIIGGTAHPHEEDGGVMYNVCSLMGRKMAYTIVKFSPNENGQASAFENGQIVASIPVSRQLTPSYYHSFGMTENYFVFVEQPLVMSVPKILFHKVTFSTYADCMQWRPEFKTRFHVLQRKDSSLLKTQYISKAFMCFHHINTYEEDDHLVVDICCYENGNVVKGMYVEALKGYVRDPDSVPPEFMGQARRYVLPLKINKEAKGNLVQLANSTAEAYLQRNGSLYCKPEMLCTQNWPTELPRIYYEKVNGRKYRYFYSIAKTLTLNRVVKRDLENKGLLFWEENGTIPSEPIFVADSTSLENNEDDGVLIFSLLFENDDCQIALVVLDARSMTELGRVVFKTESSVPGDFHGIFIPKIS